MHAKPPAGIALLIESPELEHPDFSGPSFLAAKKKMLLTPDELPEPPESPELSSNGDMSAIHAELLEIADQLDEASEKHSGQATRIREICDKMYAAEEKASPNNGEAQELY
jgi:hypothetical protein